jgi:hypothetical protein
MPTEIRWDAEAEERCGLTVHASSAYSYSKHTVL